MTNRRKLCLWFTVGTLGCLVTGDLCARSIVSASYSGRRTLRPSQYIKPQYLRPGYALPHRSGDYTVRYTGPDVQMEVHPWGSSVSTSAATNRSPSLSPIPAVERDDLRAQARQRAANDPATRHLFEGSAPERRQAAEKKLAETIAKVTVEALSSDPDSAPILEKRNAQRNQWGAVARDAMAGRAQAIFSPAWWAARRTQFDEPGFYFHSAENASHWWQPATWSGTAAWLGWKDAEPLVHDYDFTVYYKQEVVYVRSEPVSAYKDYTGIVADAADASLSGSAWEPLGSWALSTDPDQSNPNMMVQLAVSSDGRLGGAYYNTTSDNAQPIRGTVNEATQRVSFRIGAMKNAVLETGMSSLTRPEAPVWVHFDDGRVQTWLLARLDSPEETAP